VSPGIETIYLFRSKRHKTVEGICKMYRTVGSRKEGKRDVLKDGIRREGECRRVWVGKFLKGRKGFMRGGKQVEGRGIISEGEGGL